MTRPPYMKGITMFVGIDDSGKVFIKCEVPSGHFTTHQFGQLIAKMEKMKSQADKIKRAQVKDAKRKEKS